MLGVVFDSKLPCFLRKWLLFVVILGFWISDLIQNLDHLQTNLFLTIQNSDKSGIQIVEFQIPTVHNLN